MPNRPFQAQIGSYLLSLPGSAEISCDIDKPSEGYAVVHTHWTVLIGRFSFGIHLDPVNDLGDLKRFIDHSTKSDVNTNPISVNGIAGVTYGSYASPVTRIDWWFKKGDAMICLDLQGIPFPFREHPTEKEVAEHQAIVGSLSFLGSTTAK
jgi:hypothetical protein